PRLQGGLRRRRHDEPLRDPSARRLGRVLQRGSRRGVGEARDRDLLEMRLAQSGARGSLAVPPVDPDPEGAHEQPHVPDDDRWPRAGHEGARQMKLVRWTAALALSLLPFAPSLADEASRTAKMVELVQNVNLPFVQRLFTTLIEETRREMPVKFV